jgi:hypothetical protein
LGVDSRVLCSLHQRVDSRVLVGGVDSRALAAYHTTLVLVAPLPAAGILFFSQPRRRSWSDWKARFSALGKTLGSSLSLGKQPLEHGLLKASQGSNTELLLSNFVNAGFLLPSVALHWVTNRGLMVVNGLR